MSFSKCSPHITRACHPAISTWSYFLVLVRTLSAAFWTNCSLLIKRAEQPPSKALQ